MELVVGAYDLIVVVAVLLLGWWWLNYTTVVLNMSSRRREEEEEEISGGRRPAATLPRGSSGWPFIGETLQFIASGYSSRPVTFMDKRKSLYGDVFRTHILGKPIIASTDPEVNKIILQNHGNVFIPCYPKSVTELLGESSILRMNGSLQKRVHAGIGGFLRSPQLRSRIARDIENSIKLSLSTWKDKNGPLYLQDETKKITFEVLVRVLMSIGPGEEMNFLKKEFEEFIKGLICLPIKFPGTRLYKSLKAKERLLGMVRKIVEERKMNVERNDQGKDLPINDAIDALLRDRGELNETEQRLPVDFISGNIVEMMIPGEDSVPMVMTLAVKYLSDNPIALARVLEENMALKKRKASTKDDYAWNDYISLQFTQDVISETLRMANIINAVWRKSLKDVQIKGYLIPKGWCVMASFTSVHMDDKNYENPDQFDPWRWEKGGSGVNSNNFTPFGGGQRLCPGLELSRLEISIFLHHLLTNYRWAAEEDNIVYFPTVKMKRKLPITVVPTED